MTYLDEVIKTANKKGIRLLGVSKEEVCKKERELNVVFPNAYKEYLMQMGKDTSPGFLTGADCFFKDIVNLKKYAEELLEEDETPFKLKDNYFVFWMMQGMIFAFFKLNTNDDPEIFVYDENSEQEDFFKISPSFSSFLNSILQNEKGFFRIKDKL